MQVVHIPLIRNLGFLQIEIEMTCNICAAYFGERVYGLGILLIVIVDERRSDFVDERRSEDVSNNTNPQPHPTFSPSQYVYLLIEMLTHCLFWSAKSISSPKKRYNPLP